MLHGCKMRVTFFFFLPDTKIMQDRVSDGVDRGRKPGKRRSRESQLLWFSDSGGGLEEVKGGIRRLIKFSENSMMKLETV